MAGHLRTQRRRDLSSGGRSRNPEDTRGHATRTVRDREAPGSNPGPPTIFDSKSAISEVLSGRRVTAGAQIRGDLGNPVAESSGSPADLNSEDSDVVARTAVYQLTQRTGP